MKNKNQEQKGYIAFITALIISGIILTLMMSFPLISTDGIRSYQASKKGLDTRLLAHSCAEISFLKIQRDVTYEGESLSLDGEICTINVEAPSSTGRIINIDTNVDGFEHSLEIELEMFGRSVSIISWETL